MDAECWTVRDVFGTLFFRQLKQADTIILNKTDLLEKDDIPQYLKEIHEMIPGSQVIPAVKCRIEPDVVWLKSGTLDVGKNPSPGSRSEIRPDDLGIFPYFDSKTGTGRYQEKIYADTNYVTFSFSESSPMDETAFNRFVEEMPWELFRLKGVVNFGDRTLMINSVGGKTQWEPWEGEGTSETRLAFVGWDIEPDGFLARMKACVKK